MTDKKISELTAGSAVSGSELVMIVQGGVTKRATIDDIMAISSVVGGELLAGETNAMGIDFTYHTDITKQHYISDLTTPANNYNGVPYGKLTYTSPSLKMTRQSDGVYRYANHNYAIPSEDLTQVTITLLHTSVTANATTAPDGTMTASLVTEDGTTNQHSAYDVDFGTVTMPAGASLQWTVYAKPAGRTWAEVNAIDGGNNNCYFQLTGGGTTGTTAAGCTSSITALANGWYKLTVNKASVAGNLGIGVGMASADATQIYAGDGSSGMYFWGIQAKRTPVNDAGGCTYATGYLATTAAARYDLPYEWNAAGVSQGILIEEARTNYHVYSQAFDNVLWVKGGEGGAAAPSVTANQATAPDGTLTADEVAFPAITDGDDASYLFQGVSATPANAQRASFWVKAKAAGDVGKKIGVHSGGTWSSGFTLTADWQRISVASGGGSGNTALGPHFGNGTQAAFTAYVWGAQAETGAFDTSPIHTIAAQVTRATDDISIARTAIPYANSGANSWIAKTTEVAAPANSRIIGYNTGNTPMYIQNATTAGWADAADTPGNSGIVSWASTNKIGIAYNEGAPNASMVVNGGTAVASANADFGSITTIWLGASANGSFSMYGHLQQITLLKRRATNGELQTRTT